MRIAQYYPWVYLKSGIERTMIELVKRSRHEHTIYTNRFDRDGTFPEFRDAQVVTLGEVSVRRSLGIVAGAARTIALQKPDLRGFDAVLVHCDGLGDLFLLRNGHLPCYCFCHTPLRPCFDPEYFQRVAPKYHGWKKLPLHMARSGFRAIDRWLWRRYRYVFFNSEETLGRARAGGLLRSIGDRYEIAHPGLDVNRSPVSERFEPFFLVPGRIMWTKNIESAVAGFLEMKRRGPGTAAFRMVVAGHVDEKSRPYLQALRRLAAGREDIEFVISPSDAELSDLYRRCYAAVFTAWNEDWGMAPLEANAAGKPVLASRRGGLLESQVDGVTGFLVEPEVSDIAAGLLRLAKSPARVRMMGAIARLRVARFDWSNLVRRIDDVLEERAGDPGCRTGSARPASCVRVSIPLKS